MLPIISLGAMKRQMVRPNATIPDIISTNAVTTYTDKQAAAILLYYSIAEILRTPQIYHARRDNITRYVTCHCRWGEDTKPRMASKQKRTLQMRTIGMAPEASSMGLGTGPWDDSARPGSAKG